MQLRVREHMRRGVKEILLGMTLILIGRSTFIPVMLETSNKGHYIENLHRYHIYTCRYFSHVHTHYACSALAS